MPSLILTLIAVQGDWAVVPAWMLAFLVMFCFYECGYIFNEVICVRFEENPTLRIAPPYRATILRHVENLLTLRLVLGVLGSWWLLVHYPTHSAAYIVTVLALFIVYSLHNFYRGPLNLLTMAGDVSCKYLIPMALFMDGAQLALSWLAILLGILGVRVLEYAANKEFLLIPGALANVEVFRLRYYVVANAVAVLLAVVGVWSWLYCLLPGYFLCYRIGTWFLMRHSRGVQERIRRNRQQHGTLGE